MRIRPIRRTTLPGRRPLLAGMALLLSLGGAAAAPDPAARPHLRRLLDNAFEYVNPAHGIIDPASGYPVEGWNQEPERGLFLRSFTQLTAIGAWVELLANVAAGQARTLYLSRTAALDRLDRALASLLDDQRNPDLAARGLLVNFLGLEGGKRAGPLLETIERQRFIDTFGEGEGAAIWRALVERGWLQEEDQGRGGRIRRGPTYGGRHFDGALAPHADDATRERILALLDRRVVTIIFGDNANLTAALARAAGALLHPDLRDNPRASGLRERIERFIAAQRDGYAHLFDPATGTFVFGWDATADRFVGWDDGQGHWVTGQMNYLINEFRGPWTFVVARHDLPVAALRNAGLRIQPYRRADGTDIYALAAWDGSAFQLLGLSSFMQEDRNPGWRESLATLVDILLEDARRRELPGLLSEAYSGNGTEYTGAIGIPELAVTDRTLITHAPSLYALGVAASIAPDRVESLLREHWSRVSGLFTDHGPWEGWDLSTGRVIPYQTTAHTLSLILGGIGSAQDNMRRYLDAHGITERLAALHPPGDRVDLLVAGDAATPARVTLGVPGGQPVSLSNGRLLIRYRAATAIPRALLTLRRAGGAPPAAMPIELALRFQATPAEGEGEIAITLPATPALTGIGELVLDLPGAGGSTPPDLSLTGVAFIPFASVLESAGVTP